MALQRVVVGVDGSPGSAAAVRWVADYAQARQTDVTAVYVLEPAVPLDFTGAGFSAVAGIDPRRVRDAAQTVLHTAVAEHAPDLAPEVHEVVVEHSSPPQALLHAAEGASLLVLGAHHHHALGLLFGSTASGCARHATCPVVIVPEDWRRSAPADACEEVLA